MQEICLKILDLPKYKGCSQHFIESIVPAPKRPYQGFFGANNYMHMLLRGKKVVGV